PPLQRAGFASVSTEAGEPSSSGPPARLEVIVRVNALFPLRKSFRSRSTHGSSPGVSSITFGPDFTAAEFNDSAVVSSDDAWVAAFEDWLKCAPNLREGPQV